MSDIERINEYLDSAESDMIELQSFLTSCLAMAPESGGDGELSKCEFLQVWLRQHGITDLSRYDASDCRVKSRIRPNLLATIPGIDTTKSVFIIAHLDVVPVGDLSLWHTDPWKVVKKGDKIFGRGVEDNQQGLVSGVFAALALIQNNIKPLCNIKLLFVADEEVGSAYGMQYLLENHHIFSKDDLIIIPDGGDKKGETIEIAEKNLLWLKITTKGMQAHGSRPDEGNNAFLAACELACLLHDMGKVFDKKDSIFEPNYSTFEPTKKEANVPNVNTIPGDDVFYMDCRILPCYSLDTVRSEINKRIAGVQKKYGVKISFTEEQAVESPATDEKAPVVKALQKAIKEVKGINSKLIGIGGGTVGASLRKCGFNAVVWSTLDEKAHQIDEYCIIQNMIDDAKVLAFIMMNN